MSTSIPPSLPSFAQAFPNMNIATLPPIQHIHKRSRDSIDSNDEHSPPPRSLKREPSPSPSAPSPPQKELDELDPTPTPSPPRPKKRRIIEYDSASPAVVSTPPPSADQGALDQIRAMLSIKQKKELVDQRRVSTSAIHQQSPAPSTTSPRLSAAAVSALSRRASIPTTTSPRTHPIPLTPTAPNHQSTPSATPRRRKSHPPNPNPFPVPVPIAKSSLSGTTRAAPPKPLMLPPRSRGLGLEPLVHSAPVIGGAGFAMRVPEVPPIPGVAISKSGRVSVPHTPTLNSHPQQPRKSQPHLSQPQPHSQQQSSSSYSEGKPAFLQLFSDFYDSLVDARVLKEWLGEQLAKSNLLVERGASAGAVEELRNEVEGLRRRVGELEEMLYREREGRGRNGREKERDRDAFDSQARISTSAVRLEAALNHTSGNRRPSPLGNSSN